MTTPEIPAFQPAPDWQFDVTLDEEQAKLLRDHLVNDADADEAFSIRLIVGEGHSGHGLYVAQAEYQDEGAVLLAEMPAFAARAGLPVMGGRESVEDALAIVESFGSGIDGLNDAYARQIILAEEVKRLQAAESTLAELVELKDMKDGIDQDIVSPRVHADYAKRKPVVWSKARSALRPRELGGAALRVPLPRAFAAPSAIPAPEGAEPNLRAAAQMALDMLSEVGHWDHRGDTLEEAWDEKGLAGRWRDSLKTLRAALAWRPCRQCDTPHECVTRGCAAAAIAADQSPAEGDALRAAEAVADLELLPEDRTAIAAIVAAGYSHARKVRAHPQPKGTAARIDMAGLEVVLAALTAIATKQRMVGDVIEPVRTINDAAVLAKSAAARLDRILIAAEIAEKAVQAPAVGAEAVEDLMTKIQAFGLACYMHEPGEEQIAMQDEIRADLIALDAQPTVEHPDDVAVDALATAMKAKLADARAKGRSGWQTCPPEDLSLMLREHVEKGDPRDVANFCAFLWALGKGVTLPPTGTDNFDLWVRRGMGLRTAAPLTDAQVFKALEDEARRLNGGTLAGLHMNPEMLSEVIKIFRIAERAHGIGAFDVPVHPLGGQS